MKKGIYLIIVVVMACLTVHAQTLVLSDNFDTGGVSTNDLNYNLAARQSGTAATNGLYATTNGNTLTASGKLNVKEGVTYYPDTIGTQLGGNSFRIKLNGQQDASASNWTMLSVISNTENDWDKSPMTVNLWQHDWLHISYGDISNVGENDKYVNLSPLMAADGIGGGYSVNDPNDFEIRVNAETATNGTWSFHIDGNTMAAGLPYTFQDANLKMSWWSGGGGSDMTSDDMDISTIPSPLAKEYLFFENFDGPDNAPINWLYGTRQTNGLVVGPYSGSPDHNSLTNNKLNDYFPSAFVNLDADLQSHLQGKDFEFSFKAACKIDGTQWSSIYLYDGTQDAGQDERGSSRFGMYIPGVADAWACVVYHGTGAAQELHGIDPNWYPDLIPYDKTQEHTFLFVSTAGAGGMNTYELFIDGVEIFDGVTAGLPDEVPYYFNGSQRRIGIVGVMPNNPAKGCLYDDVYVKLIKGITYADWVMDDTGLTAGVNDARTDDPDLDGMDNLLEYVLGGNPLFGDAATTLPTLEATPDVLEYIYNRRNDAVTRGLTYGLLMNTSGLQFAWTNVGSSFETGSTVIDAEFDSVTNIVPIVGKDLGFVNLEVMED